MRKIFSEPVIIIFFSVFVMFLNIIPLLNRLHNTLPDRTFTGAQFYTLDYNIYLGHFKEGAKGIWLIHNKHSSEPHTGFLLRREYIIWGFLTGYLLHLPIQYVYHSARIISGLTLLLIIYWLIKELFPDNKDKIGTHLKILPKHKRIFAFLFATLVAGFPKYTVDPATGTKSLNLFLYWLLEIDASQRFATLFHYLLGNILLLLSIIVFIKFLKSQKTVFNSKIFVIASIVICLLATLIHPSTLVTIYLLFGSYLIIRLLSLIPAIFFYKSIFHKYLNEAVYLIIVVFLSIPSLLFLKAQVSTFPWTVISRWDKVAQTPVDLYEYIMAIGPVFYLGVLGMVLVLLQIIIAIIKGKTSASLVYNSKYLILASFPLATFLLAFKLWPYLMDINRIRFLQVPIFVPFAIFTTIFLSAMAEFLVKLIPKLPIHRLPSLLLFIVFIILVYLTFPAYRFGVEREAFMFPKGDGLIYPDSKWVDGLLWLDKNTKPEEVVMGSFITNGLIPGFSGNYAYSGHPWNTVDFDKKETNVVKFFSTQLSADEAQKMLKDGHVNYIFYSYLEKSYGGDLSRYHFLVSVYNTLSVTIFRVK